MTISSDQPASAVIKEFLGHLPPRRRKQLALLMLLMLLGAMAEIVTIGAVVPFISLISRPEMVADYPLLQNIFRALGWQRSDSLVLPMAVAFVGIVASATAIRLLLIYASNKLVFAIGRDIGVKLYRVMLYQPYAYHISQNTSDVIGNINKVQILLGSFLNPAIEGITAVILSIAIFVALMIVEATTALTAGLLFAFIYFAIVLVFRTRLRSNSKIIASTQATRIRSVQEGLGGIRDVILDANQPHYASEFAKIEGDFRNAQAANAFLSQAPRFVIEGIGIALIVALAYALSLQAGGLLAALPTLGALALGAQRLLPLVQKIYLAWAQYAGNFNVLEDVLSSLSLPDFNSSVASGDQLPFKHDIKLEQIYFRYSEDEPDVLSEISLTIPKGRRVGIVGKTGSGKSTLMDIVMGLLEPTKGRVLVDDTPINAHNRNMWRTHIAHVPQHIYLSDASIAENIALGVALNEIDQERVRQAAHQAQISDFIKTHRRGYNTRVGERGIQLSGGQRQRIGIARALYKNADVLVFDEASSALDTNTEEAVMSAVDQLDRDLTVFVIAHRTETLRQCEMILRVEGGCIIASGVYENVIGSEVDTVREEMKRQSRTIEQC